uniref:Putative MFS transporter n=1 Tax=Cladonia uncialis subsp. uncialis TaxID=180999 RepID=A0A1Z1C462_CLAUC|nr:putative MFS transporter [Cladonia uncialis subsp. uncialis]
MSRYPSYNEEADHEKHTKQSLDESPQRTEYGSRRNSDDTEQRFHSNTPHGDSISLESLTHPQTQSRSHRNSAAKAVFPIPNESFSHPLVREPTGAGADAMVVDFDGEDDPYRPMNWPFRKKVITTILYGFTTCWITFASAIYSPDVQQIAHDFDVSIEVATTGISMVVFGFGLGPLIWAPLSEVYGRKWAALVPYFIAAVFSFASGAAKDIQTLLITRFFTGFFGSAPITNTGGVLGDIWSPEQRGVAVVGYAVAVIGGPTIGPVVGGAITSSDLRWRWTEYLTGIVLMAQLILDLLLCDESYAPTLLVYKARRLRHESGNWTLHAKHEEWDVSVKELAQKYLIRPVQMLFTPICFLISLYAAFVYGILYANLAGFSIAFEEVRGWGLVTGNLPFLAIFIGILGAAVLNVYNNKYYFKRFRENGNRPVPEARLPPMMIGGILFAGGLFLFAWTSSPNISYWPSIIGIGMTGFGFTSIFQAALNYLIDTFTRYAASAVAANTFMRSVLAGAFPLFVDAMYHNIGVDWGSTIFGCVAVLLVPVPFIFFLCL